MYHFNVQKGLSILCRVMSIALHKIESLFCDRRKVDKLLTWLIYLVDM